VDQRGAPLSAWITGANQHDKWSLDDLVIHILLKRPTSDQHLCADKGYDYPDVHQFVTEQGYQTYQTPTPARRAEARSLSYPRRNAISGQKVGCGAYPSVGWRNGAAFGYVGAKSRKIAYPSFTLPALAFWLTWHFWDRFLDYWL
jgi:transposase